MRGQGGDPVRLLLHAVDQLAPTERTEVLAWLIEGGRTGPGRAGQPSGSPGAAPWPKGDWLAAGGHLLSSAFGPTVARDVVRLIGGPPRGEQQLVPVRLPVEQHAALRTWCQEHGFTMATVVRGLVAQFLDEQGAVQGPAQEARPANAPDEGAPS